MLNLFWPVYKNLENELQSMTYQIHFDDAQLCVYSEKFVDLLMRISIEIETISKQLYLDNGGVPTENEADMYFDTICLDYLESKWMISKKIVFTSGLNFYFNSESNKRLTPLKNANKRGASGSQWKRAYQAVKHDRNKNYALGNMKNCIHALAALFILNLYYKEKQKFSVGTALQPISFDPNFGSTLFTPSRAEVSFEEPSGHYDQTQYTEDLFIISYDNDVYNRILQQCAVDFEREKELLYQSKEYRDFLASNPTYDFSGKSIFDIVLMLGEPVLQQYRMLPRQVDRTRLYSQRYCMINRNQTIYQKAGEVNDYTDESRKKEV